MKIKLSYFNGNVLTMNKQAVNFQNVTEYEGEYRSEVDLSNPEIYINTTDDLSVFNYLEIETTSPKKYFFIEKVVGYRKDIYIISCHIDVLMCYKESVESSKCMLYRTSYTEYIDPSITDSLLSPTNEVEYAIVKQISTPLDFQIFKDWDTVVINVIGKTTTIVTPDTPVKDLTKLINVPNYSLNGKNYGIDSFLMSVTDFLRDVVSRIDGKEGRASQIYSVYAYPFAFEKDFADKLTGATKITLGYETVGDATQPFQTNNEYKSFKSGDWNPIVIDNIDIQYNNDTDEVLYYEPLSTYKLLLPFTEGIEITYSQLKRGMKLSALLDIVDGYITYVLSDGIAPIHIVTGQCNTGLSFSVSNKSEIERRGAQIISNMYTDAIVGALSTIAIGAASIATAGAAGAIIGAGALTGTITSGLSTVSGIAKHSTELETLPDPTYKTNSQYSQMNMWLNDNICILRVKRSPLKSVVAIQDDVGLRSSKTGIFSSFNFSFGTALQLDYILLNNFNGTMEDRKELIEILEDVFYY